MSVFDIKSTDLFPTPKRSYAEFERMRREDPAVKALEAIMERERRAQYAIDYVGGPLAWLSNIPDLLDPPDSYPFIEWDDLIEDEQAYVLACRVEWAIDHHKINLDQVVKSHMAWEVDRIPAKNIGEYESTKLAAEFLRRATGESEEIRKQIKDSNDPQPARPGHLMAEGSILARARGTLKDGMAYTRKETFNEPVNAFTMLYGSRIAVGGDMLTAVTLTDTQEHQVVDYGGGRRTVYTCSVMTL